jgi:hypothetical protein
MHCISCGFRVFKSGKNRKSFRREITQSSCHCKTYQYEAAKVAYERTSFTYECITLEVMKFIYCIILHQQNTQHE